MAAKKIANDTKLSDEELFASQVEALDREQKIENARDLLHRLERNYGSWQVAQVVKASGVDEDDIAIGTWDCPSSPINICAYGPEGDDFCLFCGGPDERK